MINKIFPKIHDEGYKFIIIFTLITIILYFINGFLGFIGFVLTFDNRIANLVNFFVR